MKQIPTKLSAEEICELVGPSPTMLEIGSHDGTDTARFLAAMPRIRLHCFEPDHRPILLFKALIGNDPRVVLHELAVADIDGFVSFYPSTGKVGTCEDWHYSGSIQRPTGHLAHSPEVKFKAPIMVPCIRLETWWRSNLDAIDFAWIDVQGAQRALIAGGRKTLAHIRYIYIECHHEPLYENEPTQEELITLLRGFEPLGIYEQDNLLFKNRSLA